MVKTNNALVNIIIIINYKIVSKEMITSFDAFNNKE